MADMKKLNVLSYNNLVLYDELLKGYINEADAKALKTVAIDGFKLKFYTVEEPVGETAPAFEIELPKTDLSGVLAKLTGAVEGDVVIANADGSVKDSGVKLEDLATDAELKVVSDKVEAIENAETGILATAKSYTDEEVKKLADGQVNANKEAIEKLNGDAETEGSVAKAVKDAVDGINDVLGEITEGKTVAEMIADAQAAATYDDTAIKASIGDLTKLETEDKSSLVNAVNEVLGGVEAHKTAIDKTVETLVGNDTGKSVRTIANEELAAQLLSGDADADFQTLQELAAWLEDHPEDVATINLNISNLQKLVGTLPEDATSTDVVSYIAEVVAAEKTRAEGVESGLDTRLKAVEDAVGEGGSVDTQITNAIAELDADVTSAEVETGKGLQVQVVEVDGKITTVNVTGNYDAKYDALGAAGTAESNAKTYADNLDEAMDTRVTSLEEKVGEGCEEIPSELIYALFATDEVTEEE